MSDASTTTTTKTTTTTTTFLPLPALKPDPSQTKDGQGTFLVLGDWGNPFHPGEDDGMKDCWGPHWRCNGCGQPPQDPNFCTVGAPGYEDDEFSQTNVSAQMSEWATANEAQFLINVGDNFYPRGVDSVHDPQWTYVFEKRYADKSLQIPWFSVLGNHDYGGFQCFFNSSQDMFSHAQAQIDYDTEPTWEWPQPKKTRWIMPNLFYKKQVVFGNVTIDLFMIDTNFEDNHDGPAACGQGVIRIPPACEGTDFTNCKAKCAKIGDDQKAWLLKELPKSTATWKFLVGHHPLTYLQAWIPGGMEFLRKNNISAYFCGHVHGMNQAWYSTNADGNMERTVGATGKPGAIFEMQNGAGGGSFPDSGILARWGFTGVRMKAHSLEITYVGESNEKQSLVSIPHSCVQNWPGQQACDWIVGPWDSCSNQSQSRNVWCMGGSEEHCPKDVKPNMSQACVVTTLPPAPAPSPDSLTLGEGDKHTELII